MVFYFTGTGNSWEVAKILSLENNDMLISIADAILNNINVYNLHENERIGFVFPCHGWAPPKIVINFIKNLKLNGYCNNYMYFVVTCEIDIGYTDIIVRKCVNKIGYKCNAVFSLIMPNNYILFWGFDIDNKSLVENKYCKIKKEYELIANTIRNRLNISHCNRGNLAFIKSYFIRYLFYYFQFSPKKFHVLDNCTSCGLCTRCCPLKNLKITNNKPVWGEKCVLCLSCIHICPSKSIQYGKITLNKGRYFNSLYHKYLFKK